MPADGDIVRRPAHLARQFALIGDDYDGRPGYPARVFELLVERCGVGAGTDVVEIGPGTGQATLPLLDLGARVTAVEPGAALAAALRRRARGRPLRIVPATFEAAALPAAGFDVVAAATSFHWVDVETGVAKCGEVLRDGGWLALWWTVWGDPDRPDPLHDALRPLLRSRAPHLLEDEAGPRAYLADIEARVGRAVRSGLFGPVEREVITWSGRHDPVGLRRMFATFAGWIALEPPVREELLDAVERVARDDLGGVVERPYLTVVHLAARRPR